MTRRIDKNCEGCGRVFSIPKCKDWREHSCSTECKSVARKRKSEALKNSRKRECIACGAAFIAKKSQLDAGQAKYCSLKCARDNALLPAAHSPEARRKAAETLRSSLASGRLVRLKGAENPTWKGGRDASKRRNRTVEKRKVLSARLREYRNKNPDKVREFSRRRKSKKVGCLPKGCIEAIRHEQENKCPLCGTSIEHKSHVDHIFPLSKGGKHESKNIQLLCPSCNVRKSAKHPVQYMLEATSIEAEYFDPNVDYAYLRRAQTRTWRRLYERGLFTIQGAA